MIRDSWRRVLFEVLQFRDFSSISGSDTLFPRAFANKSHVHEDAHLGLALAGSFTEVLRGKEEKCVAGVIRYLPAGQQHATRLADRGRALYIRIQPSVLERLKDYTVFEPRAGNVMGDTFHLSQRLVFEFKEGDHASPLAVECLVLELLIQMNRARKLPACIASPALLRARDFLHEHDSGPLRLDSLARQVGMHPVHLSRGFHRAFNRTMSEYFRDIKIQRARTFLAASELPLSEISELCGFHDQSHFSRSFKRAVGTTPLEYRRRTRS